jgi:hypothetical protein
MDDLLIVVEVLDELRDASLIMEGVALVLALVGDRDLGAGVQERELAQAVLEDLEGVHVAVEDVRIGLE